MTDICVVRIPATVAKTGGSPPFPTFSKKALPFSAAIDILLLAQIVALELGMISQVLLVALLASAQGNLAAARTTYSKCLGSFTRAQVKERVEGPAFEAKLATACKAEEAAFRAASIATDVAAKIARATAERNAQEEIGYIHENALESFKGSLPPDNPQ
ncbi:MAG TPA: hypothetical protein VFZ91_02705 [Allosphingosinicella sp.]